MEQVTDGRVISFHNELLVELQGVDERGEIATISYSFTDKETDKTVSPKEPIHEVHRSAVEQALDQEGYELVHIER